MDEISFERPKTTVFKLDDDEQALMDEIQISPPAPRRPKPAMRKVQFQRPVPESDPELDAFINPNKQTAPMQPPPEQTFDYGEEEPTEEYGEQDGGGGMQNEGEQPSSGYTSIDD